jgi:hypothetical protein
VFHPVPALLDRARVAKLTEAGAGDDRDLVAAAQALMDLIDRAGHLVREPTLAAASRPA